MEVPVRASLLSLLLLPACSALEEGFEDTLTREGGCGDVVIFAADADDHLVLRAETAPGPVADLLVRGEPMSLVFELPSASSGFTLVIEAGTDVTATTCTDVVTGAGPEIERRWVPVSGTATLTLTPAAEPDQPPSADLLLEDVGFVDQTLGGNVIHLQTFRIEGVAVGWFPG